MKEGYRYKYDPTADALYIYVRTGKPRLQREYTDDIILDLDDAGQLIGIELLNPVEADLRDVVREYALDPHLLDVLSKLRHLMPEARHELTLG